MFGVDTDIGSAALRLWVAAGSAALLVFVCALAFDWTRTRTVARVSVVVLGAVLGATLAWVFLDAATARDQSAERRALEMRAAALNAQTLAPGSSLACLDGLSGENVEAACEKALFAAPATVATATSYTAARLVLLSDMAAYTSRGGTNIDSALLPLRRSLETDRFGFVAHTLAARDGCTSDNCKVLTLLHDASRVRTNLSGQTLERYLDHYVTAWGQLPDTPVAEATPSQPSAMAQPGTQGSHKVVDIDFPSASSIPAVSIMNAEPKGPVWATAPAAVAAGAAGADANAAATSASPKRTRKQAGNPASQAIAAPPAAPAAPAAPVDQVWTPGAKSAAPQATASPVPTAAAPVQLYPNPGQPGASAGTAARTQ
jgi:hypothetical protein